MIKMFPKRDAIQIHKRLKIKMTLECQNFKLFIKKTCLLENCFIFKIVQN